MPESFLASEIRHDLGARLEPRAHVGADPLERGDGLGDSTVGEPLKAVDHSWMNLERDVDARAPGSLREAYRVITELVNLTHLEQQRRQIVKLRVDW